MQAINKVQRLIKSLGLPTACINKTEIDVKECVWWIISLALLFPYTFILKKYIDNWYWNLLWFCTQTYLTKASKVLYTATRNRAYFQKIFFLLPNTWTNRPEYKPSTSVTISGADIIFSAPRSTRRNFSHTRMSAGCGHQGLHTQLLTDIFSNSHPLVQSSPGIHNM